MKAIKNHTCDFCFEPIEKGTQYLRSTHKMDGEIYDFKCHDDCYNEGLTGDVFQDIINDEYYCLLTVDIPKSEKSRLEQIANDCYTTEFKIKIKFVVTYYNSDYKNQCSRNEPNR